VIIIYAGFSVIPWTVWHAAAHGNIPQIVALDTSDLGW
jgi:hypothetical protein